MKLCVVSVDADLIDQCKSVLSESHPGQFELTHSSHQSDPPAADIYIWDFKPECFDKRFPSELAAKTLFIVDPSELKHFRDELGGRRVSILLKPVHPAAFEPFLQQALPRHHLAAVEPVSNLAEETRDRGEMEDLLDALLHANHKLQEYDRSRTNFLARAVHDFRAPLTALSGYCELLIQQRLGMLNVDQIELLGRMQNSLKRISRLADGMFDLSMCAQRKQPLELQISDIESSINQAIHEVAAHANQKELQITVSTEEPSRTLLFDPVQIERVLINLLENACKFTGKGGSIEVSSYPVSWNGGSGRAARKPPTRDNVGPAQLNAYRVDVRDSGIGIASQYLETIFEEYTSYSGGNDRSGGGLGLAICRMIVEAHGGTIWAESNGLGTQFSFVIPPPAAEYSRATKTRIVERESRALPA